MKEVPGVICNPGCIARMEDRIEVIEKFHYVDVIVLVYDISRPETLTRANTYWLPLIESTTDIPVVLVGNKVDLRSTNEEIHDAKGEDTFRIDPVLKKFKVCGLIAGLIRDKS